MRTRTPLVSRFLHTALTFACFATAVAAQKPKPKEPTTDAVIVGDVGKQLDAIVLGTDKPDGFCGSVLVASKGEILLDKGYGLHDATTKKPIGRDAMWDWASVSKQFTAAALLRLQDQKKLSLDDALTKFYRDAGKDKAKVTLRHLLNHTSGMPAGFRGDWKFDGSKRGSLEQFLLALPPEHQPGERFEYSNSGYALAAAVVEEVTGKSFEEFCVEQLFVPAGMKDTCLIGWKSLDLERVPRIDRGQGFPDEPKQRRFAYGDRLNWGYRGCGGVVATARDMFLWDRALRGDKLLSAKAKLQLYTPGLQDYALGWYVRNGGRMVEHSGGVRGVVTWYQRWLDDDIVVAIACSYEPKSNPGELASSLARRAKKGAGK